MQSTALQACRRVQKKTCENQEAAYRQWGRAVIDYILDLARSERLIRRPLPPKLTRSTAKRIRRRLVAALAATNRAARRVDRLSDKLGLAECSSSAFGP